MIYFLNIKQFVQIKSPIYVCLEITSIKAEFENNFLINLYIYPIYVIF